MKRNSKIDMQTTMKRAFTQAAIGSWTTRPSNRCTVRSACSANRSSCVTMQIVAPPAWSSFSRSITASPLRESRFPVGSSAKQDGGLAGESSGDGDALLLTAGKLTW